MRVSIDILQRKTRGFVHDSNRSKLENTEVKVQNMSRELYQAPYTIIGNQRVLSDETKFLYISPEVLVLHEKVWDKVLRKNWFIIWVLR